MPVNPLFSCLCARMFYGCVFTGVLQMFSVHTLQNNTPVRSFLSVLPLQYVFPSTPLDRLHPCRPLGSGLPTPMDPLCTKRSDQVARAEFKTIARFQSKSSRRLVGVKCHKRWRDEEEGENGRILHILLFSDPHRGNSPE